MIKWLKKIFSLRQFPIKTCWWWGTDALRLVVKTPGNWLYQFRRFEHRLVWRFAWRKYHIHEANNEELRQALIDFGIPEGRTGIREVKYDEHKFIKIKHKIFTVLFYMPEKIPEHKAYGEWIYGKEYLDYLRGVVEDFPEAFNLIVVDGKQDMATVYPYVDCFIKINKTKYNGINRIGKKSLNNDIPVLQIYDYKQSFEKNCGEIMRWLNVQRNTWRGE